MMVQKKYALILCIYFFSLQGAEDNQINKQNYKRSFPYQNDVPKNKRHCEYSRISEQTFIQIAQAYIQLKANDEDTKKDKND